VARPWNEDLPAASLRLERGGSRFLRDCAEALFTWVPEVRSPATLPGGGAVWRQAGFTESGRLLLFEHPLTGLNPPAVEISEDREAPLAALNRIDREAFPAPWRLGRLGLTESVAATSKATIHTFQNDGTIEGFAVTGVSLGVAYLQRLAVAPAFQGAGIGRALVRASLRWARGRRVVTLLVNTQPDNDAAASLYRSEGFRDIPAGLQLWTYRP
jgi:GNAT superfamily N-acetyltransferase